MCTLRLGWTSNYLSAFTMSAYESCSSARGCRCERCKTECLFSFQYGRFEVRAQVPEAQGFWPAGWLLGNNITTVNWPACGEQDVLERVNGALTPDWNEGS